MTEYGICPECDNKLDQAKNVKYKTILNNVHCAVMRM